MVVDDWQRPLSNSRAFLIGQALLQMQGPHVTKKKDRILVKDLIGSNFLNENEKCLFI